MATRAALALSEMVVTETGFGSDLGAEKFFNVVSRLGRYRPDAVVVVATAAALKLHGGRDARDLATEDIAAVEAGLPNLDAHLGIVRRHGVTPVVAVNRLSARHRGGDGGHSALLPRARRGGGGGRTGDGRWRGVPGAGGGGADGLRGKRPFVPAALRAGGTAHDQDRASGARNLRGRVGAVLQGGGADAAPGRAVGWEGWPICVAKTQYSLSDDPAVPGRPQGHEFSVREMRPSAGAGFMVVLAGEMVTMPGLPTEPAATRMRVDSDSG